MNLKEHLVFTKRHIQAWMNRPLAGILMFHRINVLDKNKIPANEHLKVSPEYLDNFIVKAKAKGFSFVSLDELADILSSKKPVKKLLSITLDDGYRDNMEKGLPIFQKHQVPFCIYITTKMIEKQFVYWWYLIEDLILQNDTIALSNGIMIDATQRQKAFLQIRKIIMSLPQENLLEQLKSLFTNHAINWDAYNEQCPLTWEDISRLKEHPLASIGCHTHSHYVFSKTPHQTITQDIQMSIDLMKQKADLKPVHFAFPFGDRCSINKQHDVLLKPFDFKTITTTKNMFCGTSTSLQALPRIFISETNGDSFLKQFELLS